jgi:hypothetical protein
MDDQMVTALRELADRHEFNALLNTLKAKAELGHYCYETSEYIDGDDKHRLERLGFKLDDYSDEDTTRISW